MRTDDIFRFIRERHAIFERRVAGKQKPWTQDPILQRYKFCNVYRELDTVTIWIRRNWRETHEDDTQLWFALAVARYINWPDALAAIGYPIPFKADKVCHVLKARQARGEQVFTGAYFINSLGPKIESVVFDRLARLWDNRRVINAELAKCDTLLGVYSVLISQFGFGTFMAGQVIADLKYVPRWHRVSDWNTFAVPGPGSRRGLNRVFERDIRTPWRGRSWFDALEQLQAALKPRLKQARMFPLHAQDLQGCLCEWDKYERVRLEEGKPRSLYAGV